MNAIDTIITTHTKGYQSTSDETWDRSPICMGCGHAWPCDTAVLATEVLRTRHEPSPWLNDRGEPMGFVGCSICGEEPWPCYYAPAQESVTA